MSVFDLAIIGFGVIGVEALHNIKNLKLKKKKKKFKIAVIEKNLNNIPGGIAYNKISSKFGYFNNPLRLSHPSFINWIKIDKNRKKLINFARKNPKYNLNKWIKKNKNNLNSKKEIFYETYFPRLFYAFFLKEKIIDFMNNCKKLKIDINFYNGEITKIKKENILDLNSKKILKKFNIKIDFNKLKTEKTKKTIKKLRCKKLIIGNGLLPPKKIPEIKKFNNSNYIWDFYAEGGTGNLLKKIKQNFKKRKNLNIIFIGNKAGLLETMQELENLIIQEKSNINIYCISKDSLTLQKAEFSKNYRKLKFKYLRMKNIKRINFAQQILNLLKKEFNHAVSSGFSKYDVWTRVLKKNIIQLCYQDLSQKEKKIYNLKIFPVIRSMTRYTYPDTVGAKERLGRLNKIKYIKDKAIQLIKKKKSITVKTKSGLSIEGNIVINVSGPVKITEIKNEVEIVSSLKQISKNFNERGFYTNNLFMVNNSIFAPGTLAINFNPWRQTIIKAITNNTHKVTNHIIKNA